MPFRNRAPRTAALFLSIAVGGASLTTIPVAQAVPVSAGAAHAAAAVPAPVTVVARLSAAKGVAGDTVFIQGTKLADKVSGTWTAKAVKFGATTVAGTDVTALSGSALVVKVPAGSNGTVDVLVGDATKGPKFTYAAPITITTTQSDLTTVSANLVSETGLAGAFISGTNFTAATKVLVGGKPVTVAKGGVTATRITFAYPAALTEVQDVVVVDSGVTHYVGYVTYHGKPVTLTAVSRASVFKEQATSVELTGTNLDLAAKVTYNGAPVAFKKGVDATKLIVTIPVGGVVSGGDIVVTTKYAATATIDLDRVAAPVPTVTKVEGAGPAGVVTLTGTNLTGLKAVIVKNAAGKALSGSKITNVTATSAKVTLPALPNGTYTVSVTAISATASTAFSFTVGAPAPTVTAATSTDGETIVITGTNLTGTTAVKFGTGADVTTGITVNSATQITVVLPSALADGTYDVRVTTPGGSATGTGALVVDTTP